MVSTAINVAGMPTTDNTWVSLTADLSAQAGKQDLLDLNIQVLALLKR